MLVRRIALAAAILAVAAPGAQARPIGANLARQANNTASCQSLVLFQRVTSCSWSTSGALFNGRESLVVPGSGTITRISVRVGPRTGPMRVSVLRALRRENAGESACCIGRRETRLFTPRPNRVTTLRVNLPVTVSFNRVSRMYAYDNLFLSLFNPNTPIPAHVTGTGEGNCSGGWFPAVRPRQENFTGPYGVCGATILLRAEWVPRG